jgi:hypothetical protein
MAMQKAVSRTAAMKESTGSPLMNRTSLPMTNTSGTMKILYQFQQNATVFLVCCPCFSLAEVLCLTEKG